MLRAALLAATCASLGACATVIRGPEASWAVNSTPSGALVQTSNGLGCAATPCSLRVSRKVGFVATISKPGYKPMNVNVSNDLSTGGGVAFLGNAVIGGLLGATVDIATGAIYDPSPNNLNLVLQRDFSQGFGEQLLPPPPMFASEERFDSPAMYNSSASDGRVVAIKVFQDGSVQETREAR